MLAEAALSRLIAQGGQPYAHVGHPVLLRFDRTVSCVQANNEARLPQVLHKLGFLHFLGEDSTRILWILKKYNDTSIKLIDSSIVKDWEVLQVVTSFLLAGGLAAVFFGSPRCASGENVYVFLAGLVMMLLFAVLLATSLCRMFLYGQYTLLVVDSKNLIDARSRRARQEGTEFAEIEAYESFWVLMEKGMVKFSDMLGLLSAASKGLLLIAIVLWMVLIIFSAYRCHGRWVAWSLLCVAGSVLVVFFTCLVSLLLRSKGNATIAQRYSRVGQENGNA